MEELAYQLSLLDNNALYLFTINKVTVQGIYAEFELTIQTSSKKLLSRWSIRCNHCFKAHIDKTDLAREVTIKYDIFIVGSSYFSGSHFSATRLN